MEFKELQEKISKIFISNAKRDNIEINDDYLMVKITEELGELMQSYLVHKKKCRPEKHVSFEESQKELAKELSDVIALVFAISSIMKVDIEEALEKKWITRKWIKKK